jgi:ribosomal protein S27AE
LVRMPCIRCGEAKSVAHHEDYDKPLEVMWLCQPCHKQRHKELKSEF